MLSHESISILIPLYNASSNLITALDSAVAQSWPNKEIIIVDDCSTDNSYQIACDYASKYSFIHVYSNSTNMGAGFTRNRLVQLAKSDIVCFFDDDDSSHPDRIANQYKAICNHGYPLQKNILNIAGVCRIYPNGYHKQTLPFGSLKLKPTNSQLIDFLLFFGQKRDVDYGFCIPTCALMCTTFAISSIGGFDAQLRRVEDVDLALRMLFNNVVLTSVPNILVYQNSTSGLHKTAYNNFICEMIVVKKNKHYLTSKHLFLYCKLWTKLRFYYFSKQYLSFVFTLIALAILYPFRTVKHFCVSASARYFHEQQITKY